MNEKQKLERSFQDERGNFWIVNSPRQDLYGTSCMSLTWSSADLRITAVRQGQTGTPALRISRMSTKHVILATFSSWATLHSKLLQERRGSHENGESDWNSKIQPIEVQRLWQLFIRLLYSEIPDNIQLFPRTFEDSLVSYGAIFRQCMLELLWSTPWVDFVPYANSSAERRS